MKILLRIFRLIYLPIGLILALLFMVIGYPLEWIGIDVSGWIYSLLEFDLKIENKINK